MARARLIIMYPALIQKYPPIINTLNKVYKLCHFDHSSGRNVVIYITAVASGTAPPKNAPNNLGLTITHPNDGSVPPIRAIG